MPNVPAAAAAAAAPRVAVAGQLDGEIEALFRREDARLRAVVSRRVRTSPVNIEDACAFAWLQLCAHHPRIECAFHWLCRTAIREAVKLHRRTSRTDWLDDAAQAPIADRRQDLDARLRFIAACEAITATKLSERQAHLVGLRARYEIGDEIWNVSLADAIAAEAEIVTEAVWETQHEPRSTVRAQIAAEMREELHEIGDRYRAPDGVRYSVIDDEPLDPRSGDVRSTR